jgi:hypothetical protein
MPTTNAEAPQPIDTERRLFAAWRAVVGGAAILVACAAVVDGSDVLAGMPIVLAQAGSTGGTIGKQGKSASGSEPEDPSPTPQRPHRKNAAGAGCKLASTWSNVAPAGSSIWTISSNGTAVENGMGNARGRAVLSGHNLVITWQTTTSQGTYAITLSQDCTAGNGTVIITAGPYSGLGGSSTFTAIPRPAN